MTNSNHNLEKAKDELRGIGEVLRASNPGHRDALRARIVENVSSREPRKRISMNWKRILVPAVPSVAVMALALVTIAYQPNYYASTPVYLEVDETAPSSGLGVADFIDATGMTAGAPAPTFRQKFIRGIGSHSASQKKINDYRAEHGDLLDESMQINVLTREEDAVEEVEDIVRDLGGYVQNVRGSSGGNTTIKVQIPKDELSSLRDELKDLAKSDDHYSERRQAYNRVADAVVIDEKIQEVEEAITELEEKLANAEDENLKAQYEAQLAQHRAYLEERQETKEELMEQVEYADVSIAVTQIESWWRADSYYDMNKAIAGFESPGFAERLWINVLFVTSRLLIAFSYTFWIIIPLGIWWFMRRKRRSLFAGLD